MKNTPAGLLLPLLLAILVLPAIVRAQDPSDPPYRIMAWGNNDTPDWAALLHLSGLRLGCSSPPDSCMRSVGEYAHNAHMRIFLAVVLKPETVSYAAQYSELSRNNPTLEEVGLDDFESQYEKLFRARVRDPQSLLQAFISGLKSRNPALRFGITLYEDDLSSDYLADARLPAALRGQVDDVHLYLHYRADAPNYERYVEEAKAMFPRAHMIAGLYPYDRISYVPCAPDRPAPCTLQQEQDYFAQSLDTAIHMLKTTEVSWIEFYPDSFGREQDLSVWREPRACAAGVATCAADTRQLRQILRSHLEALFPGG